MQGIETLYHCSCLFIRQLTKSCNGLSRMTVHVAGPRASFLREVSPTLVSVQLLQQKFVIRTSFSSMYIPTHGQEMMLVLQDRPIS